MSYPSKETHTASSLEQVDAAVLELVDLIARQSARELNSGINTEKQEVVPKHED